MPITFEIHGQSRPLAAEALLDTGFDGDLLVPPVLVSGNAEALRDSAWQLADGSWITASAYHATLQIGDLRLLEAAVTALGNEVLIGRGVTRYFTVTFDHARQAIVEP